MHIDMIGQAWFNRIIRCERNTNSCVRCLFLISSNFVVASVEKRSKGHGNIRGNDVHCIMNKFFNDFQCELNQNVSNEYLDLLV